MARIDIPKGSDFAPHPEGNHKGGIFEVEDLGMMDTAFGQKHKVCVKIESRTAQLDDGRPAIIYEWWTVSSHKKSTMRQRRETLLGRKLTDEEADGFDTDELVGTEVGFVVEHNVSGESTYANIVNMWPLDGAHGGNGSAASGNGNATSPPTNGLASEEAKLHALKCIGELEVTGKMGTDAAEKYRAWLAGNVSTTDLDPLVIQWDQTLDAGKAEGAPPSEGAPAAAPPPVDDTLLPF